MEKAKCLTDEEYQLFLRTTKIDIFNDRGFYSYGKQFCSTCPVKRECLVWANYHDEDGVWGGESAMSRRRENSTVDKRLQGIVERMTKLSQDARGIPNAS